MKYVFERYDPDSAMITGVKISTYCGEVTSEFMLRISNEQYSKSEIIREEFRRHKPELSARASVHAGSHYDEKISFMHNMRNVEKTCGARFCAEKLKEALTSSAKGEESLIKTNGARLSGITADLNTITVSLVFRPAGNEVNVDDYRNALDKTGTILQGVVYHSPETAGLFNCLSIKEIAKIRDILHIRLNEDTAPKPKKKFGTFLKHLSL